VTPGKPYASNLYQAIIGSGGGNRMPPSAPLSLENRTIISVWIEQGANLTTCNDTTTTGGGGGGTDGTLRACYSRDIQPVLSSHCAMTGCHDAGTHAGEYVFYSYTSTMGAVHPGSPSTSKLYQVLFSSGEEKMPPSSKPQLTTAQIDSISKWISYGALDQTCAIACDTINPVTFSGTIWPIMQSNCTGCHGGTSPSGGITISGYSDVSALAASGTLMNAITGKGVPRMPLGGPFTTCQIRQFQIWVNNGHLNN
jgi:mono/diheme cytochrome c family protein